MLLTRYALDSFRRFFLLSLSAFAGLYLLIEFFDKIDNLTKLHASLLQSLIFFSCKLPLILVQISPLAVLMGVFLTIGGFSRNNELTAMRAGGMSLTQISLPLLVIGFLISLTVLAANEWLVPKTIRQSNYIYDVELVKPTDAPTLTKDKVWLRDANAIVNIRLVLPEQKSLQGITIQTLDQENRPISRIDAVKAVYRDDAWRGEQVTVTRFNLETGDVESVDYPNAADLPLSKTPEDFKSTLGRSEEMGVRDLAHMVERVNDEGYDATRYRVDLQGRLATPFANFIMAFIGIPFALQRGRGSSLAAGIAVSVVIGISYHLLSGTMLAFGYSGTIPVMLAAWTPNLLFGVIGIWLLRITR